MLLRTYTPVAKSIARYTALGSPAEHCGICRFYAAPNICARVLGPVVPAGWCKFFSREAVFRPLAPYASGIPPGVSLDLSFMSPGSLDPRVTFTRASTATYFDATGTMRSAGTNTPRWDYDPVTHALRGVLIEESRTNIALNSANFTVAPWSPLGLASTAPTVAANAAVAPDGTTTATRVNYPAVSGGVSTINNNLTVTTAVYTFSVWARGVVGGETIWLSSTPDGVSYSRAQMTLTTSWQRFTLTPPAFTGTAWVMLMGVDMRDGSQSAQPAQSVYLWGAQVEQGAFATSYIPTTAAAVTRAQDSCMIPPANMGWFTPPGGSWMAEFIGFNPPSALTPRVISYPAAGNIHTISGSTILAVQQYDGAASMGTANTFSPNTVVKAATTWAVGAARSCLNAGAIASSAALTAGYAPLATGGVRLMADETAGDGMSGYLRRMRYWPRILTNAELQSVTT